MMNVHTSTRRVLLPHGSLTIWDASRTDLPLILFVHGAWHGSWCFNDYGEFFSRKGIACAAVDLRGRGGRPQDNLFLKSGQAEMASDVVDAVNFLDRQVILVGHSAGGAVSAIAASKVRCEGLALLAPAPPAQLIGLITLPPVPDDKPVPPPDEATVHRRFFPNHQIESCRSLSTRLVPESPALLNDRRGLRVKIDRGRISGPALLVAAGRDDPTMHAQDQDYRAAQFYNAEFHFVAEAGHCFMLEPDWQREAGILLRWYLKNFAITGAPTA